MKQQIRMGSIVSTQFVGVPFLLTYTRWLYKLYLISETWYSAKVDTGCVGRQVVGLRAKQLALYYCLFFHCYFVMRY